MKLQLKLPVARPRHRSVTVGHRAVPATGDVVLGVRLIERAVEHRAMPRRTTMLRSSGCDCLSCPARDARCGRPREAPLGPTDCIRCIGTTQAARELPIGGCSSTVAIAMRHEEQRRPPGRGRRSQAGAAVVAELDGVGSCLQKRGQPLRLLGRQFDLTRSIPRPADAHDHALSGPRPGGVKELPFIVVEAKRGALRLLTHAANLHA
jgi:hypothetical protein